MSIKDFKRDRGGSKLSGTANEVERRTQTMRTQSHSKQRKVVATKWAEFSTRLMMCLWKERIILWLCLGTHHNTLQLCFCLFYSYEIDFVPRKYQIYVLFIYSGFIALLFLISRVPHPELCLETAFSRMRRQHQAQVFHVKRCISPVKNLAMLFQAEIQILDCCFTRQSIFFFLSVVGKY